MGPLPTAGLPALILAVAVAAMALAVYLRTLAPTVTLIDSGELALAARDLGVAHPPGTPLWVLLAHAATRLPWSNVAARVAAASAVFAALAAGFMVLVAREALLLALAGSRRAAEPAAGRSWVALVPPAMAGLTFAFSRSLWSYATVVEVYSLNVLLILAVLFLLLRWSRQGNDFLLYAAAVVFGLALGVHHVTVALTLPALVVIVHRGAGADFFRSRRLLIAAAAATLATLAAYAYLPWAASRRPVFNWGDPSTLERIVWHVTGRQYQAYFETSSQAAAQEIAAFLRLALRQFGPPFLPLTLVLAVVGGVSALATGREAGPGPGRPARRQPRLRRHLRHRRGQGRLLPAVVPRPDPRRRLRRAGRPRPGAASRAGRRRRARGATRAGPGLELSGTPTAAGTSSPRTTSPTCWTASTRAGCCSRATGSSTRRCSTRGCGGAAPGRGGDRPQPAAPILVLRLPRTAVPGHDRPRPSAGGRVRP